MRLLPVVMILAIVLCCARQCVELAFASESEVEAATAIPDPESGQGRAENAGRALLGQIAPAVKLKTIDGDTIDLAELYGKQPVYLKFWATWCVPCREQMLAFARDYEALKDKATVVAINTGFNETLEGVRRYRQRYGLRMPIVIDDGRLTAALNLRVTPQHVVIGRDGRILYVGHLEDATLQQAFAAALKQEGGGSAVQTLESDPTFGVGDKPYGLKSVETAAGTFPVVGPLAGRDLRAILFFSPWCESYLAKSNPQTAEACRRGRLAVNQLSQQRGLRWLGIASGLWASEKDLADYRKESEIGIPLTLDGSGRLFRAFGVHDVPTIILVDHDGRIVSRIDPKVANPAERIRAVVDGE
ncbi:redoxin domain-containing protein [Bradyrhizobium mercantei]|uniref:redoxin domain-containing protein n=1 Tax=Bradyrhizobium mercantei TaxID=1904807 RepID=UPI001AED09D9|nr:redoxin domain-containing protein [Bradyrhizobium mercantei]